ncbi:pentatricopeptide repeat-containing protein At4g16470 [Phragmites australis]|uniref:pentatricopeptide repeat-containing protein At4g16470 n=1 Tax=Phragmites australis TaxID=29695 RepID=UPI002D792F46|nr:pentatricopeptide repeat-containing protein At4g16470 [Phragmites australis]
MCSTSLARILKSLCIAGDLSKAVSLLWRRPVCPDARTYALLLQECVNRRDAKLGKRVHARMVATGFRCNDYITTKLLIFYAKIGDLGCAQKLFDGMPHRSIVAWNVMVSGCARGGAEAWAVETFDAMRSEGMRPDQFTFASVLCACARLAALEHGRRVHGLAVKSDVGGNVFANSALVDMYLKCSSPEDAHRAFAAAPERNVTMWTAVISGHGQHGRVAEALALFDRMAQDGFRPNDVTFLAVLSACAHVGLVDEGLKRFTSMSSDYGLAPRGQHYAVVIDMLARVGRLQDAYDFVKSLPDCQEHSVVWGALLGACRKHGGDVRLVELAARRFFQLQPGNAGKYVVLANTYAAREMWDSVAGAHEAMRSLGVKKDPAWSAVEVQGKKHTFLAGDSYHDECSAIYEVSNALACAVTEQSMGATDGVSHC